MTAFFKSSIANHVYKALVHDPNIGVPDSSDVEIQRESCERSIFVSYARHKRSLDVGVSRSVSDPCSSLLAMKCRRERARKASRYAAIITEFAAKVVKRVPLFGMFLPASRKGQLDFAAVLGMVIYSMTAGPCTGDAEITHA